MSVKQTKKTGRHAKNPLSALRNIGKAALADFALLGITAPMDLEGRDADSLYVTLCRLTQTRQDPCVHDVFTAAIHQVKTGQALDWWFFTPARKARQRAGQFPIVASEAKKTDQPT